MNLSRTTQKKILFVITKSNWGGAQRYVFDLAVTLPPTEFQVSVALGGEGILKDKLQTAGIRVIPIPGLQRDISLSKEIRSSLRLARIIRKERPDIIHLNSSKAGGIGALIARLLHVPLVVFTAHGWAFNEDRPAWHRSIFKAIYWITMRLAHVTIAVSNSTKADVNWFSVRNRLTVIHPGRSDIPFYYRDEARGILETKIQDAEHNLADYHTDFWVGTIAELHPTKQLNRVIDALAHLTKKFPNLRFIMISDGEERVRLKQQVADLGLEQHVYFTGIIPEAARLLPAFDLFVLPSRSEAFGYVLLEAGLASVPVVATDVGGIPDLITHGEHGLLVPRDNTPALAAAMERLIAHKDLRHELKESFYKRAQTFSLHRMVQQTIAVYQRSTPQ